MDVSKSGGRVTDMQDSASVASLVAAGSVLVSPILASPIWPGPSWPGLSWPETVLLAAGCASSPARTEPFVRLLYRVNQGHPRPARAAARYRLTTVNPR